MRLLSKHAAGLPDVFSRLRVTATAAIVGVGNCMRRAITFGRVPLLRPPPTSGYTALSEKYIAQITIYISTDRSSRS